jgi:hypothetical protein
VSAQPNPDTSKHQQVQLDSWMAQREEALADASQQSGG